MSEAPGRIDSVEEWHAFWRDVARRGKAGQAHDEFVAFVNFGNGANFWRGLLLMHEAGECTLPEPVMKRFAAMAGAMLEARTDRAIALAAGLHLEPGTRRTPNKRAVQRLQTLKICSALWQLELERRGATYKQGDDPPAGMVAPASYSAIAERFDKEVGALRTMWSRYKAKKQHVTADGGKALAAVWAGSTVTDFAEHR